MTFIASPTNKHRIRVSEITDGKLETQTIEEHTADNIEAQRYIAWCLENGYEDRGDHNCQRIIRKTTETPAGTIRIFATITRIA